MLTKQIASKYVPAERSSTAPSTGKAIKLFITLEAASGTSCKLGAD